MGAEIFAVEISMAAEDGGRGRKVAMSIGKGERAEPIRLLNLILGKAMHDESVRRHRDKSVRGAACTGLEGHVWYAPVRYSKSAGTARLIATSLPGVPITRAFEVSILFFIR